MVWTLGVKRIRGKLQFHTGRVARFGAGAAAGAGPFFDQLTVTVVGVLGFDDSVLSGFSAIPVQVGITGPKTPSATSNLPQRWTSTARYWDRFRNSVPKPLARWAAGPWRGWSARGLLQSPHTGTGAQRAQQVWAEGGRAW